MPFYLPKAAKRWFSEVREEMDTAFDAYNLCLLAGLISGNKSDLPSEERNELTDVFPRDFSTTKGEILALFLATELEKAGLDEAKDRAQVHEFLGGFLDHDQPSKLSEKGLKEINRYCWGGWEMIHREWIPGKPYHLETLLPEIYDKLTEISTAT